MADYVPRQGEPGAGAALAEEHELKRPRRYKVLLLNDHYTTMDFVILVLEQIFRKAPPDAERIMLQVHKNGIGVAGVYVKAVAEAKVAATHTLAREQGFPLRCDMEAE